MVVQQEGATMNAQLIPVNLVRLRREARKTQELVADAAGLSRAAYRAIEKGRSIPRVENLRAIAAALGVPLRELVTPTPRLESVRFRSLKKLKRRDQVLVAVARWLQDFNELERLLDARKPHRLSELWDFADSAGPDRARAVAGEARRLFGLDDEEPIHDLCGLLAARGVKVYTLEVASDGFLGLSVGELDGGPAVVVNVWPRLAVEHWIFSAVHELGHLILHRDAYDVRQESEDREQEREAEAFASHFLVPERAFRREWEETAGLPLLHRVLKVKRVFRVSWRVVLYRVCEPLDEEARSQVWQRMSASYKALTGRPLLKLTEPMSVSRAVFGAPDRIIAHAGSEPAGLDVHDFQEDRLAFLVRRAVEREIITLARGAEILGLGLDEMRDLAASWTVNGRESA
jgi:Zn-dependent peptidase ImmA (M78 family)/transcriptional regulator with XRE-family HTH domain